MSVRPLPLLVHPIYTCLGRCHPFPLTLTSLHRATHNSACVARKLYRTVGPRAALRRRAICKVIPLPTTPSPRPQHHTWPARETRRVVCNVVL